MVEFSKVRAALAKRGNSWKIKLLPKPVGIIAKTFYRKPSRRHSCSLRSCQKKLITPDLRLTLVQSTRQRGFIKITRTIRVGHLGDDRLMTTLLGDDVNCHNWPIRGYIRNWYTGTGRQKNAYRLRRPVSPQPARVFRISFYWTTFHHNLGAWSRLRHCKSKSFAPVKPIFIPQFKLFEESTLWMFKSDNCFNFQREKITEKRNVWQ